MATVASSLSTMASSLFFVPACHTDLPGRHCPLKHQQEESAYACGENGRPAHVNSTGGLSGDTGPLAIGVLVRALIACLHRTTIHATPQGRAGCKGPYQIAIEEHVALAVGGVGRQEARLRDHFFTVASQRFESAMLQP